MRDSAAAGQARSLARRLLLVDGLVVIAGGVLAAVFASWLAVVLVVIPVGLIFAIAAILIVYGAALALAVWTVPVRRGLVLAVVVVNAVWVVAVGLLLGVAGGRMPETGRWLLTASAVVAGTFAALEWMVPRKYLP